MDIFLCSSTDPKSIPHAKILMKFQLNHKVCFGDATILPRFPFLTQEPTAMQCRRCGRWDFDMEPGDMDAGHGFDGGMVEMVILYKTMEK